MMKKYEAQIAGRLWVFPQINIVVDALGRRSISIEDTKKMDKAVALEVCGETASLTLHEFEFLVSLTSSKNAEIAAVIYTEPSTISNWRKRQIKKIPQLESNVLRKFFLAKIFNDYFDDDKLNNLLFIGNEIIRLKEEIEKKSDYKVLLI